MTPEREARLTRQGLSSVEAARQFAEVYPSATHRVVWAGGDWTWISVVGLHQRYEVRMTFSMDLGVFSRVSPKDSPSFQILEVESVSTAGTLRSKAYTSNQRRLSEAEWTKIRRAKGDLTAIGFPVLTDSPVNRFDEGLRMD